MEIFKSYIYALEIMVSSFEKKFSCWKLVIKLIFKMLKWYNPSKSRDVSKIVPGVGCMCAGGRNS